MGSQKSGQFCTWLAGRVLRYSLSLSLSLSLSPRFNGHFPGEPGLAVV